jgi:hypothetical protein
VGNKAHRDEGDGRILLGNNTSGGSSRAVADQIPLYWNLDLYVDVFDDMCTQFDLRKIRPAPNVPERNCVIGECLNLVWRIWQERLLEQKSHSRIIISGKKEMAKPNSRRQALSRKNIRYGKDSSSRKYRYYVWSE